MKYEYRILNAIMNLMVILSIAVGLWMTFSLFGCAAFKTRNENSRQRDCMVLCGAIESAKCWDNPTLMDGLQSAADLASCMNACVDNFELITAIDFSCLGASKGCDKLEKCVEFKAGE